MAGQGPRAEGVRHGGCQQPPYQSDGGASKMDEEEPGKSASCHQVLTTVAVSISVRVGYLVEGMVLGQYRLESQAVIRLFSSLQTRSLTVNLLKPISFVYQ